MGNIGPVYLAWSHLRHKRSGLIGPLLVLLVCLLLMFTQVGLLLMQQPSQGASPTDQAAQDLSPPQGEAESGGSHHPIVRGFGSVFVFLLVLLLFRHVLAAEMAGHLREFALLYTLGYRPSYLCSVFLAEMLLLILLAFVPAALLVPGVDAFVRAWTNWPLSLTLTRFGCVLMLALLMGVVAAILAIPRPLRNPPANPADIF